MANTDGTEIAGALPSGWRWRPEIPEDGEAQSLLQRHGERGLPEEAQDEVIQSSLSIIGQCVAPDSQDDSQETGLVVGYVQSGKTLSFTTVTALARDNQFPLVIVLSGTKKNLYSQTVKRLRRDLDLEHPARPWSIFEVQTRNPDLPRELTNLLAGWDRPELPGFPRKTALLTVLKSRARVDGLTNALQHLDLRGRPCLIVDDEADQHGLNTKVRRNETSPVYESLLSLRRAVPKHTYIQYTATPQALLLISVLDSLSPRFGQVLSPGIGYSGGQSFFGMNNANLAQNISDNDLTIIHDEGGNEPPESLLEALRLFYVGVAAQALRRAQQLPTEEFRSMLVHPSMLQIDHLRFRKWVEGPTESWIELLESNPSTPDGRELIQGFRSAYHDLQGTVQNNLSSNANHESLPSFEDVLRYLPDSMRTTRIREVNSRVLEQWTQEDWQTSSSHILIGGENLGRGFTVEGLTITYMPRGRGTGTADTIQQRGRFFGYKNDYLGLCRVFLPQDVRGDYENYIEHESYVMRELTDLSQSGGSVADWRRRMLLAQSLRPTRRSVMPDIYRHLRVGEWTQQLEPWSPDNDAVVAANWDTIEAFLNPLSLQEDPGSNERTPEQRNTLAENVPLARVLEDLLVPLSLSWRDAPNFSAVELAIQWHLQHNPNATATVYRMSTQRSPLPGGGKRRRQIRENGRIAELFQGEAPVTPVSLRGSVYPGDRRIHAAEAFTVQIHDLDLTTSAHSSSLVRGHVPAIAVWMPNSMRIGVFEEMAK